MNIFGHTIENNGDGNQGGFTLIETLIGVFVLSFAVLAIVVLNGRAFMSYGNARRSTREVHRTTVNLETLKGAGFRFLKKK